MHNYTQHVLLFLKRIILLLALYFISRLFFYLLNTDYFIEIGFSEFIRIFVAGIRFDVAAIVFTNIVFILFLLAGCL